MEIVDSIRYGTFTYNSHEEIEGIRIRYWMPPMATNIVLHKTSHGHFARFTIDKSLLMEWLSQIRKESEIPQIPETTPIDKKYDASIFNLRFKEVGWKYPKDSIKNNMTLRSNGAGFTIWHSEIHNEAYLDASYW